MVVSAVSPRVPIHWMTIVVVGSRNQVRNSVVGWKANSSSGFGAGACAGTRLAARPANAEPRNARREAELNMAVAGKAGECGRREQQNKCNG